MCHLRPKFEFASNQPPTSITVEDLVAKSYPIKVNRTPNDSKCWEYESDYELYPDVFGDFADIKTSSDEIEIDA